MAYYSTCLMCGANLDPGEKCDCENKNIENKKFLSKQTKVKSNGQITII